MKQLKTLLFVLLLLTAMAACRPSQSQRYERYLEDVADTTFEYITPKADSLNADGEPVAAEEADADWANDDGLVAVPDIPQERGVNKNANNYEVEKIMKGK